MGSDALAKSIAGRPAACWQRHPTVTCLLAVWGAATLYLIYVAASASQPQQPPLTGVPDGPVARYMQAQEAAQGGQDSGAAQQAAASRRGRASRKGWVEVPLDALKEMRGKYKSEEGSAGGALQHWAVEGHQEAFPPPGKRGGDQLEAEDSQEAAALSGVAPGERYKVPANLDCMQSNDTVRGRYMDIVLHKGFTNQVFALLNGLAIAHLLNVTLVLPEMTANYDYKVYSGMDIQRMQFDPAQKFRQKMSNFFDTAALR